MCESSWTCGDFYECTAAQKTFDDEYCWIEECKNTCEEKTCTVFRTDDTQYNQFDGSYYWTSEECAVDNFEENKEAATEAATMYAEAYAETFEAA